MHKTAAIKKMLEGKEFEIWCLNTEMEETLSWVCSRKGMTGEHAAQMNCLQVGEKLTLKLKDYAPNGKVNLYPIVLEIIRISDVNEELQEDNYSYELRAEAFAAGDMVGLNEYDGLMEVQDCFRCDGYGCHRCDD